MKKILTSVLLVAFASFCFAADVWLTDLNEALKKAKSEKKIVLLNFTGSDWCGWCKKFKAEVFDTEEFSAYAKNNLVLVEVDFPAKKQQSDALKKANQELKNKYNIRGYPTFVILDASGNEIGRQEGYSAGGPKPFIQKLEDFKKKAK